jgi:hypothetical protein
MTRWVIMVLMFGLLFVTKPVFNSLAAQSAGNGRVVLLADGAPPADPDAPPLTAPLSIPASV